MNTSNENPLENELHELCELVFENRATEADVKRLETLVLSNADLRRIYVQRSQEHAALEWNAGSADGKWHSQPAKPNIISRSRGRAVFSPVSLLTIICLALIFGTFGLQFWTTSDPTVAQLTASKSAIWESSDLPTTLGSRLSPGMLKLRQGMVSVTFDCGGTINVQGPAELAVVSEKECRLVTGRLVGRMDKGKSGLTILTDRAKIIDLGTEFGVCVDERGECRVIVFDGEVECQLNTSGEKKSVTQGMTVDIKEDSVSEVNDAESSFRNMSSSVLEEPRGDLIYVTTGSGAGRDCFITQYPAWDEFVDDGTMLLVKEPFRGMGSWRRRAYMAFDLKGIDLQRLNSAELCLTLVDSKMGFADRCPDATFTVYGLTEQQLDYWRRDLITWENAPGTMPNAGTKLDDQQATKLGQFVVQQGRNSGTICLKTPELAEFLKQDVNQMATVIVVRETPESAGGGTAHAFASRRHPTLSPPTLRLIMKERQTPEPF